MSKAETLERLKALGLIAVIRGPSPELTVQMVGALIAGGVKAIEITYSTPNAAQVTTLLDDTYGEEIVLGMGTLVKPEQVQESQQAGARFLVSPICEPGIGRAMTASGLVTMIGALTPTEVYRAYSFGSDVVKIFPGSLTGPGYVKALKGPFPDIPVMPTGGVSMANVGEWFAAGVFGVGAGSELCPTNLVKEGKFGEITRRAQEFTQAVARARDECMK